MNRLVHRIEDYVGYGRHMLVEDLESHRNYYRVEELLHTAAAASELAFHRIDLRLMTVGGKSFVLNFVPVKVDYRRGFRLEFGKMLEVRFQNSRLVDGYRLGSSQNHSGFAVTKLINVSILPEHFHSTNIPDRHDYLHP
jgi:hypothetical protein